jgi:pyruvate ferredoxin oxidoreductase gamma subunit
MMEIRIHGRGGQGNVVAAYLLAAAAIEEGRVAQAFPAFGAERRGAPVAAFVRISNGPFRRRCQVQRPHYLIVQDEALLNLPATLEGLEEGGGVLVNSSLHGEALSSQMGRPVVAFPATRMAVEHLGKPLPNTALLSAFIALSGILPQEALNKALAQRFRGEVLEKNLQLVEAAANAVTHGLWEEAHA